MPSLVGQLATCPIVPEISCLKTPSGYQPMYADIVQYVTTSQVYSLLLALLFVFLLVWLFIRNLKLAVLSLIPNFFPILLMLGFMG